MWRWSCRKRDLGLVVPGVGSGLGGDAEPDPTPPLPACLLEPSAWACAPALVHPGVVQAVAPPPVSGTRGRRGEAAWVFYPVRSPLWAPGRGRDKPTLARLRAACQAFPFSLVGCPAACSLGEVGEGGRRGGSRPSSGRCPRRAFPQPPLTPGLPRVAVTDRCGDLALSRAGPKPCQTRDGHSWWVGPLFSFCLRAPCSSFPPVGGAGGCRGVRTPARPRPPVAAGLGSADAADTLAGLSWLFVVGDLLPVVGGAHPMPRCSPPGRAERVAPGPPWCPWSAPGRLRCLKPSGGAVPCSQRTPLWVTAIGGDARGGRVAESVKGGTPVPPAVGSGRLVVPAPQRPLLPGGCGGLTWWGELSDRGGPSRRRGAWPKPPSERGLSVSCPARCCRCFASVFLGPHPEARRSFRAATRATARVGKAGGPCCGP